MELDIPKRQLVGASGRVTLTFQQFSLVVYLALRRAGGAGGIYGGWVELDEIVRRVPAWTDKGTGSAGKVISNLSAAPWFGEVIEYQEITKGPYRCREPHPMFKPGRDDADELLSSLPPGRIAAGRSSVRRRGIDPTELAAYDLLVQYGVYLPEVVDLVIQRVGDPARLADPLDRLVGYKIRVTIDKNRGRTESARDRAFAALKLARKLQRGDEIAYFLDQIGGTYAIEKRLPEAQAALQEEIDFLTGWGTRRASFHLAGAYRALAMVLAAAGLPEDARLAIAESLRHAEISGNVEAVRLAGLVGAPKENVAGSTSSPLADVPVHHLVGRVMALRRSAEELLQREVREEGQDLLQRALADARHLGLAHEETSIREVATRFGIELPAQERE